MSSIPNHPNYKYTASPQVRRMPARSAARKASASEIYIGRSVLAAGVTLAAIFIIGGAISSVCGMQSLYEAGTMDLTNRMQEAMSRTLKTVSYYRIIGGAVSVFAGVFAGSVGVALNALLARGGR